MHIAENFLRICGVIYKVKTFNMHILELCYHKLQTVLLDSALPDRVHCQNPAKKDKCTD